MTPEGGEKILIAQTSFLGDTVLTLPLISAARRRFPDATLALLCTPVGRELLEGHPEIDRILVDDKRGVDRGWPGLRRQAARLRAERFTIAITPHKSLRTALLLAMAGIPFRVGFRESRGWFLYHARARRDPAAHDVERNLSVLAALAGEAELDGRGPELRLPDRREDRQVAERLLESAGVIPGRTLIGINPGSVWPTKRWSTRRFADLIRLFNRDPECQVLLFGGPEDAPITAQINRESGGLAVDLAGKTPLGTLPAALGACRLLITTDSGPMHIAVARGVPVVAVFCATTPSLGFYPYSANAIVVEKNLACRPCTSHGGRRCPLGTHACSELIDADAVYAAARDLLRRGPGAVAGEPRPELRVL